VSHAGEDRFQELLQAVIGKQEALAATTAMAIVLNCRYAGPYLAQAWAIRDRRDAFNR
jgi:hypothetical protein